MSSSDKFQSDLQQQTVHINSWAEFESDLKNSINNLNQAEFFLTLTLADKQACAVSFTVSDFRADREFNGVGSFTFLTTEEGMPLFLTLEQNETHLEQVVTDVNRFLEEFPGSDLTAALKKLEQSLPRKMASFQPKNPYYSSSNQRFFRTPYQSVPQHYFEPEKKEAVEKSDSESEEESALQPENPNQPRRWVKPTPEIWERCLFPAVNKALKKEGLKQYEVDEWFRRIKVNLPDQLLKALQVVEYDVFYGMIPKKLQKYFPERDKVNSTLYVSSDSIDEHNEDLEKMLKLEFKHLSAPEFRKTHGFSVALMPEAKFNHWKVQFYYDATTKIGIQLQEFKLRNIFVSDKTEEIVQPLEMEMFFPTTYPQVLPYFRIVKPRLLKPLDLINLTPPPSNSNTNTSLNTNTNSSNLNSNSTSNSASNLTSNSTSNSTSNLTSNAKSNVDDLSSSGQLARRLSVSGMIEINKEFRSPQIKIVDLLTKIHEYCQTAEVEMDHSGDQFCHSTLGGFWRELRVLDPVSAQKTTLEHSGKIILPHSALETLSSYDLENTNVLSAKRNSLFTSIGSTNPMIFELSSKGVRMFSGVEEFTSQEGEVVCPQWIMNSLNISKGDQLQVRRIKVPAGEYLKLQPYSSDFLEVQDPKALLECVLPRYSVLSEGDTITINYFGTDFKFNIIQVKPGRVIHLVDTDINTDFEEPVDMQQKRNQQKAEHTQPVEEPSNTTPTVAWQTTSGQSLGFLDHSQEHIQGRDFELCERCGRNIPIANLDLHSARCRGSNKN